MQILVATAGHIDHGKTSLVKAITGMDPDRLPEERSRGITILPGYAHTRLPGGAILSFVDVPGHERFLNHMIQGANGIPAVLLVVAADDGVMPQTLEHLEVARLLGARAGLVIITKIDLVEEAWLELVEEELGQYLEGTFLEYAPRLFFSAVRPETHERFKEEFAAALLEIAPALEPESVGANAFLPIDRVIRVPGRGVVVTGTLGSGALERGATYRLMPGNKKARVREVQVHGEGLDRALAPTRVAANIAGVEYADVQIGAALVESETEFVDSRVWLAGFRSVRWLETPVKFPRTGLLHAGTAFAQATIQILAPDTVLSPGDLVPVRLRLDREIPLRAGLAYIFRASSVEGKAGHTLGGGQMWLGGPVARRARSKRDKMALAKVLSGVPHIRAEGLLELHHPPVVPLLELSSYLQLSPDSLRAGMEVMDTPEGEFVLRRGHTEVLTKTMVDAITTHHRERPQDPGLDLAQLRSMMASFAPEVLCDGCVQLLENEGEILVRGPFAQLPDHIPRLPDELVGLAERIEKELEVSGLASLFERELGAAVDGSPRQIREVLQHLVREDLVRRITSEYFVAAEVHHDFVSRIQAHLDKKGSLTVDDVRQMTGLTRKYLVPLLEDLDQRQITRREGSLIRVPWQPKST